MGRHATSACSEQYGCHADVPVCGGLRTRHRGALTEGGDDPLRGRGGTATPQKLVHSGRSLGDAQSSLGDANSSLGDGKSSLGDAKSSLGDAKSSLGDATSSLGDAESSLGDAKSSLGVAKSSLGDV